MDDSRLPKKKKTVECGSTFSTDAYGPLFYVTHIKPAKLKPVNVRKIQRQWKSTSNEGDYFRNLVRGGLLI